MIKYTESKLHSKIDFKDYSGYFSCVKELINDETVRSMENFVQHKDISCFYHSVNVSFRSYLICKKLGLDYKSAARGGLLHDLFLYDWHKHDGENGLHGFTHPETALKNAEKFFEVNSMEKDIIVKHMWPLTIKLPNYKESFIVSIIDKQCAIIETLLASGQHMKHIYKIDEISKRRL